ncbi:MAG: hypothetical protein MMC23_005720 [Stictis urceolatum]|nr:hypothetical protein [Stictis urceolata]
MAYTPASVGCSPTIPFEVPEKVKQKKFWHSPLTKWLSRDEHSPARDIKQDMDIQRPSLGRKLSRKVVPGLPRPGTFRRQQSERRERLTPVESPGERRTLSVDRKRARAMSARPPSPTPMLPKLLTNSIYGHTNYYYGSLDSFPRLNFPESQDNQSNGQRNNDQPAQRPAPPPSPPPDTPNDPDIPYDEQMEDDLRRELEERWILNLSMHFRDRSPREKFFVTYAEQSTRWRRVTVSIDYRDTPPESLERDLQSLQYQRDKSARIYEAIQTSLPDIQFYDTVTNLRLETSPDDRLHVHVTEDVNEIIQYPSTKTVQHLACKHISESDVHFDSHMSGFVYKVRVDDKVCIKKEIPGPDSVDEFLYEINALYSMVGSENVIQFEGLVVDEELGLVKGLLIGYAEKGPLVDLIYDDKGHLTWERRQKWAQQIVTGLSEIHEAGFVQGDFTLSNIVIGDNDAARIIDINRRGCPVGWEPPEIAKMLESGQRISMYIGVKSDLFQLGMVLWAIAVQEDEPERQPRPLPLQQFSDSVPEWYCELTTRCLSEFPSDRLSASALLAYFKSESSDGLPALRMRSLTQGSVPQPRSPTRSRPSDTQYIDPNTAVGHEDIMAERAYSRSSPSFSNSHTYIDQPGSYRPSSLGMPFDDTGSYIVPRRGRTPPINTAHLRAPSYGSQSRGRNGDESGYEPQIVPISPTDGHKWEEFRYEGRSYLIDEEPEGRPEGSSDARIDSYQVGHNGIDDALIRHMQMTHIDSGFAELADHGDHYAPSSSRSNTFHRHFDHTDSGLGDMDLAGIGGNDELAGYAKQEPHIGAGAIEDLTIEEENEESQERPKAADAEGADIGIKGKSADRDIVLNDRSSTSELQKTPATQNGDVSGQVPLPSIVG